jgi:hypothetical protein
LKFLIFKILELQIQIWDYKWFLMKKLSTIKL